MKKALTLLIAIILIMYGIPGTAESSFSRILIVCFSRAGENYNVGKIEKGNTEKLAEIIMEQTGGDLFRIETVIPYPESYDEITMAGLFDFEYKQNLLDLWMY